MLSLLFNRFPKRRPVGLLALGEWGPPTGAPVAISGSGTTQQSGQQDIASGTVVQPVITVVGGGGGGGGLSYFGYKVPAIAGNVRCRQARQLDLSHGVIQPFALPQIPAIAGVCGTVQASQQSALLADLLFEGSGANSQRSLTNAAGFTIAAIRGVAKSAQQLQESNVAGALEMVGRVVTSYTLQQTSVDGALGLVGTAESAQSAQVSAGHAGLQFVGIIEAISQPLQNDLVSADTVDTELEMVTAILLAAA